MALQNQWISSRANEARSATFDHTFRVIHAAALPRFDAQHCHREAVSETLLGAREVRV
jgi:hypothetical protein